MIRAKELDGRDVVDLESAEKIGHVDEIFLDPAGGRIAAYSVSEHSSLVGGGRRTFVPPSAVESIGPEAIMVRPGFRRDVPTSSPESFPRLSQVTGRKVVTQSGKVVGAVADVLIDGPEGTIIGYQLKDASWTGHLGEMLNPDDNHDFDYVRADADIRLGDDLLVVPDDAVVHDEAHHDHHDEHSAVAALGHRPVADARPTPHETTRHDTTRHDVTRHDTTPAAFTSASSPSPTHHWHDVQAGFRTRWEQNSSGRGGLWEEHEPAYRYGWEMSNDSRYRGRTWDAIEPDLQQDWASRHPDRSWTSFRTAIREGWTPTSETTVDRTPSHEVERRPLRDTTLTVDDAP